LNLYYGEFWTLLLKKIEEPKYGRFFAQILEHRDSGPLRKVIDVKRLIEISGDMGVINGA
jgi:transformation/transcription domain-associated protein